MNQKADFSRRLRAAMTSIGMDVSGTELERAFNRKWSKNPIRVQTALNWINGKHLPSHDKLVVLAKVVRADAQGLLHGAPESTVAEDRRREWEDKVNYAERESIEAFLRLPPEQRLLVRDVIATYAKVYGSIESGKD